MVMALPEIGKQADYTGKVPSPHQEDEYHYFATEKSSNGNHPHYYKNLIF
jgi:hypothetical protein